jgi:hypothetical protein
MNIFFVSVKIAIGVKLFPVHFEAQVKMTKKDADYIGQT